MRTAVSLFIRKFTSGDLTSRHVYRMLREFVDFTGTLRYGPCTQFINVSQRALHIYFIDGCRRIKSKTKTATCEQAPRSLFSFWLCMARNFQFDGVMDMKIREVNENKKQFISLLLLADEQESMVERYWIFLCGNTASPADGKPSVRASGNRLCEFTHVMFCPSHKPLASRYHVRHQCL